MSSPELTQAELTPFQLTAIDHAQKVAQILFASGRSSKETKAFFKSELPSCVAVTVDIKKLIVYLENLPTSQGDEEMIVDTLVGTKSQ
ncbi:hypothetical protein FRB98_003160 [Tulasnella sp. 332]|nr:hypothetical protein FRB98_003160 [Tulasnella sp. 332]